MLPHSRREFVRGFGLAMLANLYFAWGAAQLGVLATYALLDPAGEEAWLEFQLGATPAADPKAKPKNKPAVQHATLFGSLRAYEDNSRYGRFKIEP